MNTMNKTTKGISLAVAMFAIVGMMIAFDNNDAFANPKGIPQDEQIVKKINFIAKPTAAKNGDPKCGNGDNKIWTLQGKRSSHIGWFLNLDNKQPVTITDCLTESIDGTDATIELDKAGVYNIYVVIRAGAPDDAEKKLTFCIQTRTQEDSFDHQTLELCLVDTIEVKKKGGGEHTKLSSKIFKDSNEEIVYHTDQATKFKHAQIVVTIAT